MLKIGLKSLMRGLFSNILLIELNIMLIYC